ncbi:chorismate-binding protein [Advenella mimigardefordensis]|uniref:Para-aminobenzoate synthase component 1 n=1 Tax=Advenella mimigardefordensis (strain DSM 17166 / LMG 22922 / DPN7) TaxID=1247726 RepID=W0PHZ9_ADVMD|nr:chorismate-binding protein [Advenella mimigardefordensis]AHG65075.1 para-aminobenzoate synthase component 1 [Advenella mimigardefordensis DPN7]
MDTLHPFVLFDDAVTGQATLLEAFVRADTITAAQRTSLDSVLADGWEQALHPAIFIPYEFGMADAANAAQAGDTALQIHWFSQATTLSDEHIDAWLTQQADGHDPNRQPAGLCNLQLQPAFEDYRQQLDRLHQAITRGDFYQINYTARQYFETYGSPVSLYRALRSRQPVPYGVLAWLPHQRMAPWTVCLSPELFIRIHDNGLIGAEPMKGTLACQPEDDIDALARLLRNDSKNRAENLMIVDLLRNDLSMLAQPNGVQVQELFKVTRFGQVLQMTTPIQCQVRPHITMADVIGALFPCGSITGAPKKMSMHYIAESEIAPRHLYTGSIGYLQPSDNTLGTKGCFNVAIRTITLQPMREQALACTGVMGVGGGIVYDSTAQSEYEEIHWKARFLQTIPADFALFETMLVEQSQCALLGRHIERLLASARGLGFVADQRALAEQLQQFIAAQPPDASLRVRAVLTQNGACETRAFPLDTPATQAGHGLPSVSLAPRLLPVCDPLRRFKTTWRKHYDNDLQQAAVSGDFDVLYFNHDGQLLEGARTSVFIHYLGAWLTPALSLDILPGVMRAQVLANPAQYLQTDHVTEGPITLPMLQAADAIVVTNALRGCIPVRLKSA